jgi:hypothetical protein
MCKKKKYMYEKKTKQNTKEGKKKALTSSLFEEESRTIFVCIGGIGS